MDSLVSYFGLGPDAIASYKKRRYIIRHTIEINADFQILRNGSLEKKFEIFFECLQKIP